MTITFFVAETAIVQQLRARLNSRRFPEVDMFKVLLFGTGATIAYFGRGDLLFKELRGCKRHLKICLQLRGAQGRRPRSWKEFSDPAKRARLS